MHACRRHIGTERMDIEYTQRELTEGDYPITLDTD